MDYRSFLLEQRSVAQPTQEVETAGVLTGHGDSRYLADVPGGSRGGDTPTAPSVIRTPDHRLRVFVSSTLQELLPERQAARAAISRLHLSPVMFELGARPHPPRALYRAYLDQSHVFVGIYWERYGWVAPDEEVSGLEDEYVLCGPKPKLIYVKRSQQRQERLEELLDRIRNDDTASYKAFDDAAELQRLLVDDLALMLTERFEATLPPVPLTGATPEPPPAEPPGTPAATAPGRTPRWPRVHSTMVGRDLELHELVDVVEQPEVQLITLLGPGGIGKTRLALALGEVVRRTGSATYVGLGTVNDPDGAGPAVAEAYGVVPEEGVPLLDALARRLQDRDELLVLDNVEQLVDGAASLGALLEACPRLTVVATSRTPLRLAAEHEFPLRALAAPAQDADLVAVQRSDAVRLFVERARAVRPSFRLTEENASVVGELTRHLDGLPLALELAAARSRMLSPADLLKRLDRRFELLADGPRDLPSRQQTLRGTIAWSVDQLDAEEHQLFADLAVFDRGWSLEAVESVCDPERTGRVLDALAALVENNLVVAYDIADEGRYTLLESIRAYAAELLEVGGRADAVRARHAACYLGLAEQARDRLTGAEQREWLERLEAEHDNLRVALSWYAEHPDGDAMGRLATALLYFWWIRGHYKEGRQWLTRAAEGLDDRSPVRSRALGGTGTLAWLQGDYTAAKASYAASLDSARAAGDEAQIASALGNLGVIGLEQRDLGTARSLLEQALEINRRIGNQLQTNRTLINLSLVAIAADDFVSARRYLEEAVAINTALGDSWGLTAALINLGDVHRAEGDLAAARSCFAESLRLAVSIEDKESIAFALEGAAGVAAAASDGDRAARLWGAADALRDAIGTPRPPSTGADDVAADLARTRDELGEEAFDRAWQAGRVAALEESMALVTSSVPVP